MKEILELTNCINAYTGKENEAKRIRQLICYISDKESYKNEDVKELLFEASQLIRVFGYNKLNRIRVDEIQEDNDLLSIRKDLVLDEYVSASSKTMYLDISQKEVIDTFQNSNPKRIFVSAPTSFGKTHLLKEIIFRNSERYRNMVLIFPTVALLVENMDSISEFVEDHGLNYKVSNSFVDSEELEDRNIFILTPERAITIFEMQPKLKIDFFFFDEVYKIDEDFNTSDDYEDGEDRTQSINKQLLPYSRAVAFRLVLYFLAKCTPEFYLAGPFIDLDNLGEGMNAFIEKYNVQKVLIDTEATLKTYVNAWEKNAVTNNVIEGENEIKFEWNNDNISGKIMAIHNYLQENLLGTTLVYCDYPSRAIGYAKDVCKEKKINSDLQDFIQHLQNTYSVKIESTGKASHKEWSFLEVLDKGVGVHHGKMPKYAQKEILRLFNDNVIEILFCTSTLIEGVNTKAKNVIVASNNIRNRQPLNQFDIKNIVGRAGRYYHHFLGRVFFTNKKQEDTFYGASQSLNFSIFDNKQLSAEDLDNVLIEDLPCDTQLIKAERDKLFDYNLLPDEVFVKNRLFDRLQQQKFLLEIRKNYIILMRMMKFAFNPDILFKDGELLFLKIFLNMLKNAEIISEKQEKGHLGIIRNYIWNGIGGIIGYEMNYNKNFQNVDEGYKNAFDKLKTVVEYQMPRYLMLFQALYNYENLMHGTGAAEIDLSKVIRLFETGACTDAGVYLVERGMPAETIRKIEKKNQSLMSMSLLDGLDYLVNKKEEITKTFDNYEKKIFLKLI